MEKGKSIIGVDIGSSTTKMIEYKNNEIINKMILRTCYTEEELQKFLEMYNIDNIEKIVFTGIGADKIKANHYGVPIEKVEEFTSIAKGGLYLSQKEKAIIVSVGTGTALIEATQNSVKHLGGSGVGAGTLFNLCKRFLNVNNFDEILELASKGRIEKIDLRIGDITDKEIDTLPKYLTLSNFGKFEIDAEKPDIVLGILNMIFEVIGMMAAFATINSEIKDIVVIGNITAIPQAGEVLKKIEETHNIKFTIPYDTEFAVVLGAIKSCEKNFVEK